MTRAKVASTDDSAFPATVVVACFAALFTLLPVAAYQLGCLDHVPDPPGRGLRVRQDH